MIKPNLLTYLIVGILLSLVIATCLAIFIGGILFISDWIGRERMFSHLYVSFTTGGALLSLLAWFHDKSKDYRINEIEKEINQLAKERKR